MVETYYLLICGLGRRLQHAAPTTDSAARLISLLGWTSWEELWRFGVCGQPLAMQSQPHLRGLIRAYILGCQQLTNLAERVVLTEPLFG